MGVLASLLSRYFPSFMNLFLPKQILDSVQCFISLVLPSFIHS